MRIIFVLSLFSSCKTSYCFSDNKPADKIVSLLCSEGFENVAVVLDRDEAIVTYENRIYRWDIRALQEIIRLIAPVLSSKTSLILIPQKRMIPLAAILIPAGKFNSISQGEISRESYKQATKVSLDVEPYWSRVKNIPKANPSKDKIDIAIHPQFKIVFVDFGEDYTQTNLAPLAQVQLVKGLILNCQWIIPIQNDFRKQEDFPRPGLLTLNQTLRLPINIFTSVTMGYFSRNRFGYDLDIMKYMFNGKLALGGNIGHTGYAEYYRRTWYYHHIDLLNYNFSLQYRYAPWDFTMKATYGKYLYRDYGWRWDIYRRFGEVEIGFFHQQTDLGRLGGFNFRIPLIPRKYYKFKYVSIKPAKDFPWEYYYNGKYNDGGKRYNTGNRIDEFMPMINPDYIKNNLFE
ncbi:MAG: YjbH domain-containing protein [Candidatus Hatepunaea meridiana]|nr:YjbH domain-containing protein [Candidatus Hatepunaea meridiana]